LIYTLKIEDSIAFLLNSLKVKKNLKYLNIYQGYSKIFMDFCSLNIRINYFLNYCKSAI